MFGDNLDSETGMIVDEIDLCKPVIANCILFH